MKRRNFLSGLLAAPLALKARFFAHKLCTELPVRASCFPTNGERIVQLLAEGKPMEIVEMILWPGSMEQWAEKHVTPSITINSHRVFLN